MNKHNDNWLRPLPSRPGTKKQRCGCCSAFEAFSNEFQPLPISQFTKVLYQVEQFDVGNEYDTTTSTFIPRENGIYSLIASILFSPDTPGPFALDFQISVNGDPVVIDVERSVDFGLVISVSAIRQLQAGDRVEVFAAASRLGEITPGQAVTHFEAARIG